MKVEFRIVDVDTVEEVTGTVVSNDGREVVDVDIGELVDKVGVIEFRAGGSD